jgi:hypothetical protein
LNRSEREHDADLIFQPLNTALVQDDALIWRKTERFACGS